MFYFKKSNYVRKDTKDCKNYELLSDTEKVNPFEWSKCDTDYFKDVYHRRGAYIN